MSAPKTPADDFAGAANSVCTQCGICCAGVFFGNVIIKEEEREPAKRLGLRVVDKDGELLMPQPCTALDGCLCSVYPERPNACRRYECTLRRNVAAGNTSEASALVSIARMQALLAMVRASFDVPNASIWEVILVLDDQPPADPLSPAGRKLDAGVAAMGELLELARHVFEPKLGSS